MDPLTHTLVGGCMAETGLRHRTRYATATLMIGANLPDIDGLASAWGSDTMFHVRRGWTHGLVADFVLPLLLAGAVWAFGRWRSAQGPRDATPLSFAWLLGLSAVSVWSHPFLDWLNTYGVRVLMPFSDRWFYGDAIFIVDPWMWLFAGTSVVVMRSRTRLSGALWLLLGLGCSALILGQALVPLWTRLVWVVGLAVVFGLRRMAPVAWGHRIARLSGAMLILYISLNLLGSYRARTIGRGVLAAEGVRVHTLAAGAVAGTFLQRDLIGVDDQNYYFLRVRWLGGEVLEPMSVVPIGRDRWAEMAMAAPGIRGFAHWARFPRFQTEKVAGGYRVSIDDVRYSRLGPAFALAEVALSDSGEVLETRVGD